MMLFKLSLNNIRKSFKDYAVYFFTLVIGVAVFYVFNSIESQTAFLEISNNQREVIHILISLLSGLSVFVAVVLGMLIVYASRFLMKRRNKEFALYLMLGMGKGKISAILFIETFFIGLFSLAAGIGIGIIASQFTSTFTASLFEANMTEYHFLISGSAIAKTSVYFGIMYIAVMFFNGFMVGKFKLIDLLHSGRKSENIKLKNPVLCVVVFIVSAIALAYDYYLVCCKTFSLSEYEMAVIIAVGSVSTFLVFWSVSGMLLRVVMSVKKVYLKDLNSFTFRQLSSKINTMVTSMTLICLMLFVTICTLSSAFSMRNSLNRNINEYCPVDFSSKMIGDNESWDEIIHYNDDEFLSYFSEYIKYSKYSDESVTFSNYLGDDYEMVSNEFPYVGFDSEIPIYKVSEYNELMKLYGRDEIELNDGTYALVMNISSEVKIYNDILKNGKTVTINGNTLTSMFGEVTDGFVEISVQAENDGLFVVPDSVITKDLDSAAFFTGNYKADSMSEKLQIDSQIIDFLDYNINKFSADGYARSTRIDLADAATGLGGIVIFLGLYIGLIFLISSGVILALRSLSDAVDSTERYAMLRKIGADESEISKSLFRQTALFFIIPLLLACIHSVFGMKFAMSYVLDIFGTEGMAASVAGTGIIILLIYGGYFLITYFCSKAIIKEKR